MELTAELPDVKVEPEPGQSVNHFICMMCHADGSVSLCGLDATDKEWEDEEDGHVECVVCDNITECPDCGSQFVLNTIYDEVRSDYGW